MSDYVDEPLPESTPAPVEEAPVEEPAPVEEAPEAPVEEPASVEEPEPEPVEEPASVEEAPAEEPAPVSTQEVVQNVQDILTTEPAVSSDSASLEERVKVLEERLESLVNILKQYEPRTQRIRNLVSDI